MRTRLLFGVVGASMFAVACGQSDPGITTSVKSQLAADELVRARQIDVDTKDRIVTLTGDVRTEAEEAAALQIARNTDGVADVVDQLTVVPAEGEATSGLERPIEPGLAEPLAGDTGITAEVKSKLLADPDVAGLQIDVDTSNRIVTLTGSVKTEAEKIEALQIARQVAGVSSVTDRLTIDRRQ